MRGSTSPCPTCRAWAPVETVTCIKCGRTLIEELPEKRGLKFNRKVVSCLVLVAALAVTFVARRNYSASEISPQSYEAPVAAGAMELAQR